MKELTVKELAAYFDHTQLKAYAQKEDFENFVVKQMNTVLPWLQLTHLLLHAVKNC